MNTGTLITLASGESHTITIYKFILSPLRRLSIPASAAREELGYIVHTPT